MPRYKIHIDPPNLDPDRIRGHQNFDQLYCDYRATRRFDFWRNLYRDPRVFAGLAAVVVMLVLVFQAVKENDSEAILDRMGPPVSEALSPDQVWTLNASQDTLISLNGRWSLMIPAGSLLDSAGNSYRGTYQLAFRQLESPAEQFVSGATGAHQPFYLEALGGNASLVPGKGVEFRTRSQEWAPRHSAQSEWLASSELPPAIRKTSGSDPKPLPPAIFQQYHEVGSKPVGQAPQRPGKPFGVQVDNLDDFPQFRGYQQVFWEHIPTEETANPWSDGLINDTMSQIRIRPFREQAFELLFTQTTPDGGILRQRVIARPYTGAQTEAQARDVFQTRMEDYEQKLAEWNNAREERQRLERDAAEARANYEQALRNWEDARQDTAQQVDTIYRWSVEDFGLWGVGTTESHGDSVSMQLFLASEYAGSSENLIHAFVYSASGNNLIKARRQGDSWIFPNNHHPTHVWSYGRDHIWIGALDSTSEQPLTVTLRLLPDHIKTADDIVRHLQGVL